MKLDNKFIIIVPVYNAKDLIVECLSSIVKILMICVIIRDDISTDGTNTIINDFFWYEW
jgi:glycosyltransferase involved in cell wall biosynthesis